MQKRDQSSKATLFPSLLDNSVGSNELTLLGSILMVFPNSPDDHVYAVLIQYTGLVLQLAFKWTTDFPFPGWV